MRVGEGEKGRVGEGEKGKRGDVESGEWRWVERVLIGL